MKRGDWRTSNWCHTQTEHTVHNDLVIIDNTSSQVQACITYTHMNEHISFICSFESGASSMRSISLAEIPNSLSRCNGSPYVSQLLTLQSRSISTGALYIKQILCWMRSRGDCHLRISFASPRWSSITSMLSSKSLSTLFQYVVIRSSSVHSRMTTHTGRCSKGRIASVQWGAVKKRVEEDGSSKCQRRSVDGNIKVEKECCERETMREASRHSMMRYA